MNISYPSTTPQQIVVMKPTLAVVLPATTTYIIDNNATLPTTESQGRFLVPKSGRVKSLFVKPRTNGLDVDAVLTLVKNGSDQAVVVTVTAGATTVFSDLTNSFSVAAGDELSIKCVIAAGTGTLVIESLSFLVEG